jgi:uncharacterized protein (DUF488 family)
MASAALHTIGYEGSKIDDFIATLKLAKVDLVIDIRDVAISRKPGFSKTSLSNFLADNDINYLHLRGLGDPKPGRLAAREGKFDKFRKIFGAHLATPVAQSDLELALSEAKNCVTCLLCFERDHANCHRCMVAEELARRGSFRLVHLGVRSDLTVKSRAKVGPVNDSKRSISGQI